jgi:hypothetical protein
MGAAPMRDTELLDWCVTLLTDIIGPVAASSWGVGRVWAMLWPCACT